MKCDSKWEITAAGRTWVHCVSIGICSEGPGTLGTGTFTLVYTETSASQHTQAHGRTLKESVFRAWTASSLVIACGVGPGICRPFGSCCLLTLLWWPWRPATFGRCLKQARRDGLSGVRSLFML